jgi:oligosaccharide repeat unit polymerase
VLVIVTCVLFMALASCRKRELGFVTLVALEWIVLMTIYLVMREHFVDISVWTQVIVALLLSTILVGLTAASVVERTARWKSPFAVSSTAYYLLASLAAAVTLLMIFRFDWREVATASAFRTLLSTDDEQSVPTFGVGVSFPLTMGALFLAKARREAWTARLFALVGALLALLTTSKIFLLLFVLFLLPVSIDWRNLKYRPLVKYAVAALALVVGLHVVLGKVVDLGEVSLGRALALTLGSYVSSGLAGLELYVDGVAEFPENALWQQLGSVLPGVIRVPDSPILPWVQVGNWNTNTYTAFSYWIDGLGLLGAVGFAFLVGWIGGRLLRLESLGGRFVTRFYVFGVLFLFHQDFFLSAFVMWFAYLATGALLSMVEKYPADIGRDAIHAGSGLR